MNNIDFYTRLNSLPSELKKQVEDFMEFLIQKSKREQKVSKRAAGLAKGLIKINPDFEEPLSDFKEYTE